MNKPLLLLHGAIGSSSQLLPLKAELEEHSGEVYVFDFPGHGGKAFPAGDFSMKVFAESVLEWMDENKVAAADIFGYSMGGYVALYMARHYPERVNKIITLATKFEWDHYIAADMARMIDAEKISVKAPVLAEALKNLHAPNDWKEVLHRTTEMFLGMGNIPALLPADFSAIKHEVLLLIGDMDRMVTKEETLEAQNRLENSRSMVIAETPHAIEQVGVIGLAAAINEFCRSL